MPSIPAFRTALLKDTVFARGLEGLAASHRVPVALQPSGVSELDAVLGGGFPRGSLVELCGPASSGRTSLSLALLAEATQREEACAFVDVSDSLDPASLAAAGVDLRRLLWIRCGRDEGNDLSHRARSTSATSPSGRLEVRTRKDVRGGALLPSPQAHEKPTAGSLWQHPRNQMRGIETVIPSLVKQAAKKVCEAGLGSTGTLACAGFATAGSAAGPQPKKASAAKQDTEKLKTMSFRSALRAEESAFSCEPDESRFSGFWSPVDSTGVRKPDLASLGMTARVTFHGLVGQSAPAPSSETEIDVAARCAGEQAEPDRQRPRRGENVRRHRFPSRQIQGTDPSATAGGMALHTKPWKRLEQALKATDLLLHSGGWGVVVVDLGSISWVDARRIPLSTWFRFQRIVENTPTILLLLGEEPCAKSCASLVLRCQREQEKWSSAAPANGTWSPPGVAHVSHQEGLEKRRHNVAQHGSAGNIGDARTSPGRATQIASAQSTVHPVSPPPGLGVAEGRIPRAERPGLHSVRTSGAACGEKCGLGIATFEGFEIQGKVVRSRRQSLPANSARWQTRTLWSGNF